MLAKPAKSPKASRMPTRMVRTDRSASRCSTSMRSIRICWSAESVWRCVAHFGLGYCTKGSMTGRIVVPIHNAEGQLVAYAGRWPGTPPDEDTPKYKLPPGFRKARELFNAHRAFAESDASPLVIVEGFFDCLALWQHGIRRVVALMGSSLSTHQEELIRKDTNSESRVLSHAR